MAAGLLALTAAACASVAERYDSAAADAGLRRHVIAGAGFRHVVFHKSGTGDVLHIYLEGDGSPLVGKRVAAADPTPRRPLMPALMRRDPALAALLGRPCYHGLADDMGCASALWTSERYGEAVVASMSAATRRLAAEAAVRRVLLIGHSGGATLALLIAPRVPEAIGVIALAADPDPRGWAAYHGLPPLDDSLSPKDLRTGVPELFAVGLDDRIVPPERALPLIEKRPGARVLRYPGVDHACCWLELWPRILAEAPG